MKTYKIYYTESGTCYNYCKAWVEADSEEEAIEKLKNYEYVDSEVISVDWDDDYHVDSIESIEVLNGN